MQFGSRNYEFRVNKFRLINQPGVLFVIDLVPFNNLLNNVDLPTFERPVIKTLYCVNSFPTLLLSLSIKSYYFTRFRNNK